MKRAHVIFPMLALLAGACGTDGHDASPEGPPGGPGPYQPGPGEEPPPDDEDGSLSGKPGVTPPEGATEFISADTQAGSSASRASGAEFANAAPQVESDDALGAGEDSGREVERGDIFRVLGDGRILNLNAYRGLQVLDVRDVQEPKIEGRLDLTGTPVELYVVGDRAIVLLNNWSGYYGTRDDVAVEREEGGLVAVVDISDRAQPKLLDDAHVPGTISTSRLTQGGSAAALYVASQDYGYSNVGGVGTSEQSTLLRSFDVTGESIVVKSSIDLGGYVQDIQATNTDVLMVARIDWNANNGNGVSRVSLVDISSPTGEMSMGDEVVTRGQVQNKFNMDITGDVLRVVSGSTWSGTNENHLETFDISDLGNALPLDHCMFGSGEQLYATLFVDHRAFFVTYFRTDPFHAFSIDEAGHCQEHAEFIVSGWNDFFRATLDDSRLIGIGRNDEGNTNRLAVSLYDISNIDNPTPLIDRDEINLEWANSEAQWDDRAFTVLDDAISVTSPEGTLETGLVLMPFEGWRESTQEYVAQVQILTFSSTTLTRRAVLDHGSSVRRSFLADDNVAANLSEEQLSLHTIANPSSPSEVGRLDVAPSFSKVLAYGDHVARVRDRNRYYYGSATHAPKARVEIVPRNAVLDEAEAIASFEVPSGAEVIQVGDLLVSVYMEYVTSNAAGSEVYDSEISVFDLSDPTAPRARGTISTQRLTPSYGGGYYGYRGGPLLLDCFDCGGYYGGYWGQDGNGTLVAGDDALVFPSWHSQSVSLGRVEQCTTYPVSQSYCTIDANGEEDCPDTYTTGGITCERELPDGEEWCTGDIYVCNSDGGECEPTDDPGVTQRDCYVNEKMRYWSSMSFAVLDLSNPDAPALSDEIEADTDEEAISVMAHGSSVYFSYQQPVEIAGDARPFVRRYFRELDVSDPGAPQLGRGINVPGEVIAVSGDSIFTRDVVWDELEAETMVARVVVDGGVARLQAQRLFDGRQVTSVQPDGQSHVLVSHGPIWSYSNSGSNEPPPYTLSILDSDELDVAGTAPVDAWAQFVDAKDGKAIFSVSGGILIFDVEDPASPEAQAYFATDSWYTPELLVEGGEILFAAGPYGIYRFDSDTYNLRAR